MTLSLKLDLDESMIAKLMQVPLHLRLAPAERVLKSMAKPIVDKGKDLAPSSIRSGTRKKWGKNKTAKFNPETWSQDESGKHIGFVYRKTESGGYLMIGGKHPRANKLNFESGKKRDVVYWGRSSGKVKTINAKDRFMQRAFDETRDAQLSAGFKQLEIEIKELKIG